MAMAMADTKAEVPKEPEGPPILVPEGFSLYTENNAHILISSKDEAFLNPVQEFNRDMSVACIRVWSEELDREKADKFRKAEERREKRLGLAAWEKPKGEGGACVRRCTFDSWGGTAGGEGETSHSTDTAGDALTMDLDTVDTSKPRVVCWENLSDASH
jgi:tRNA (guanine26-N2/guanine27-N2)-dimethyltransferase